MHLAIPFRHSGESRNPDASVQLAEPSFLDSGFRRNDGKRKWRCGVYVPAPSGGEAEAHHIAVLDDVVLAFEAHLAGLARAHFVAAGDDVVIANRLGALAR